MLTTSKTHQHYTLILSSLFITMALWLGSKLYAQDWFENPFKYPAKAASLCATILMCWSIILSTRLHFLENYFAGLDKMYQIHKRMGKWAFYCIIFHPLFLAANRLPDMPKFLGGLFFRAPGGDRYLWGHNLGVLTFLVMALLVSLTLWIRIPYHKWKKTHEWFGMVMLLCVIHIFVVNKDIASYPLLGVWMYCWLFIALLSFCYIRFGYQRWGPHFEYKVAQIESTADIFEIELDPRGERHMDFKPSQFVYLVVHKEGISPEAHPYSIANGYNIPARLKLGIKKVGDHTCSLEKLSVGDQVTVYGPYGHFSDNFLSATRDCVFIGGGIGITPFMGMWHVALHSEERLPYTKVPEPLTQIHPEIIKSWHSPCVSLFYICRTREEACFDNDIHHEVEMSHYHEFPALEKRGHHYELYISSARGRLTADYIAQNVSGDIRDRYIFLCGPSVMVDSLIRQFRHLGVPEEQIVVEDFNLI